jgi:hypothetical protein
MGNNDINKVNNNAKSDNRCTIHLNCVSAAHRCLYQVVESDVLLLAGSIKELRIQSAAR